jgi:hypothetical protein
MLFNDGEAALRETRRVLRQDGRVALAAWTQAEDNRWSAAPVEILRRRGLIEPDPPGSPGQFAWAREGDIAEHLEAAGFVELRVESVPFSFQFSDVEDWWGAQVQTSTRVADVAAQLDPQTRQAVVDELAAVAASEFPDLAIPARTWVAVATT